MTKVEEILIEFEKNIFRSKDTMENTAKYRAQAEAKIAALYQVSPLESVGVMNEDTEDQPGRDLAQTIQEAEDRGVGLGYTLGTGNIWSDPSDFHGFAERIMDGPIWTHQFADTETWDKLRSTYEKERYKQLAAKLDD